jgi:hypothetical protein
MVLPPEGDAVTLRLRNGATYPHDVFLLLIGVYIVDDRTLIALFASFYYEERWLHATSPS